LICNAWSRTLTVSKGYSISLPNIPPTVPARISLIGYKYRHGMIPSRGEEEEVEEEDMFTPHSSSLFALRSLFFSLSDLTLRPISFFTISPRLFVYKYILNIC
jgi:hypothetical protein